MRMRTKYVHANTASYHWPGARHGRASEGHARLMLHDLTDWPNAGLDAATGFLKRRALDAGACSSTCRVLAWGQTANGCPSSRTACTGRQCFIFYALKERRSGREKPEGVFRTLIPSFALGLQTMIILSFRVSRHACCTERSLSRRALSDSISESTERQKLRALCAPMSRNDGQEASEHTPGHTRASTYICMHPSRCNLEGERGIFKGIELWGSFLGELVARDRMRREEPHGESIAIAWRCKAPGDVLSSIIFAICTLLGLLPNWFDVQNLSIVASMHNDKKT